MSLKSVFCFALTLPALGYGAGYLGAVHPFFDSMSVFAVPLFWIAFVGAVVLVWLRSKWTIIVSALLMLGLLRFEFVTSTHPNDRTLSLYQKNLLFVLRTPDALIKDIVQSEANFVTLQEVTQKHLAIMAHLKPTYPFQHHCRFASVGGVAVLSKNPMIKGTAGCVGDMGAAYMQVMTDAGPLWVVSVHQYWPWPHDQAKQARVIIDHLETLQGSKVIAGDFNMVPWSRQMQRYETRFGLHLAPFKNTYHLLDLLWIPIDHVMTPNPINTHDMIRRPFLGSDHLGLLVHFDFKQPLM